MALAAEAVSLALQGRPILAGISGELPSGAITVILGPNGAGKSMLLSCLAGLRRPDAGRVLLDGTDVAGMPARTRAQAIGLLPQRAEIHWDIDARTLVGLGRAPHRGRFGPAAADEAAIDAAMEMTGTAQLAARPVLRLSGGEQARVLLARVLAGEPRWLLADEPLASLDPAHQADMLARLKAVAAAGTGVALVLHDLTHAARVADRVLLLRAGRLLAGGPADAVLRPDVLEAAYDIPVWRGTAPDGAPLLLPVRRAAG